MARPDVEPAANTTPPAGTAGVGAKARACCVILNEGSGKQGGDGLADELETLLGPLPAEVALRRVRRGRDIAREAARAVSEGYGTIVAAGGDGTVSAVASHLADTDRNLGVLPLGTFNYFARGLGLPERPEDAVRVLAEGRIMSVHLGEVNERIFLNNAILGVYPAILQQRQRLYRRFGRSRLAAYWSVLTGLLRFRSPLRLKVTVDGQVQRVKTPLVCVASNPYQLELFGLEGVDRVRAGEFALIVAPDCGRLELVRFALRLAFGRVTPARDFALISGSDILVEDRLPRRLVARDGERELMRSPFHFKMRRNALRVLVPSEVPPAGEEAIRADRP